jgi:8-oxo-dGTP diphosphatase
MKKQKEIDWIFFDVGGVITDDRESEELRKQMDFDLLHDYDLSITREMVDDAFQKGSSFVGGTDDNLIKVIVKKEKDAERLIMEIRKRKNELWPNMEVFAYRSPFTQGILDVVKKLSKYYRLGIIANQPHETTRRLKEFEISDYFENIGLSAVKGLHKPDVKFYELVLKENNIDPKKSIMIDDNIERGLAPAKKLGMKTIWFDWGIRKDYPDWVDYKIQKSEDLLDIFIE